MLSCVEQEFLSFNLAVRIKVNPFSTKKSSQPSVDPDEATRKFANTKFGVSSFNIMYELTHFNGTTLKCLSIGTPKAVNFPFVSNQKSMFF